MHNTRFCCCVMEQLKNFICVCVFLNWQLVVGSMFAGPRWQREKKANRFCDHKQNNIKKPDNEKMITPSDCKSRRRIHWIDVTLRWSIGELFTFNRLNRWRLRVSSIIILLNGKCSSSLFCRRRSDISICAGNWSFSMFVFRPLLLVFFLFTT